MPKLKTNSSLKKRIKVTSTGKIMISQSGKRHGMTKRSKRSLRNLRGFALTAKGDVSRIKQFTPYGV